ncbi:MAG: DUF6794 domain-containing protein [bacterium]
MISNKLNLKIIFIYAIFLSTSSLLAQTDSLMDIGVITPTIDNTNKTGYYIPKDIKDCFAEIDKMLPSDIKDYMSKMEINESLRTYPALFHWIYQNWGMEDTTRIVDYFMNYGFDDGGEITRVILESYLTYKKGEKIIRIEIKPKVYLINKNLFLIKADTIVVPPKIPNPKGVINFDSTEMKPQFYFMGGKFTLIDSLYDPIIKMIYDNGFVASQNLWYVWWTQIARFGEDNDTVPYFLTEDELNSQFDKKYSYNADFILIFEDADTPIPKSILRDNKFDFGFPEYLSTRKHFGFYFIRKREVVYFDLEE